jgi:hypothetical protein
LKISLQNSQSNSNSFFELSIFTSDGFVFHGVPTEIRESKEDALIILKNTNGNKSDSTFTNELTFLTLNSITCIKINNAEKWKNLLFEAPYSKELKELPGSRLDLKRKIQELQNDFEKSQISIKLLPEFDSFNKDSELENQTLCLTAIRISKTLKDICADPLGKTALEKIKNLSFIQKSDCFFEISLQNQVINISHDFLKSIPEVSEFISELSKKL